MFEDNFFKGFSTSPNKFFDGYVPIREVTYCVVIIYDTNFRKEIYGITNPWQFVAAMKKNPRVKAAFIKDEEEI